tara:strand:+ start:357 stop:1184 length:828 start_codon:yes stop_codon:yes gene_type:complete
MKNIDLKTVESFSEEWLRYDQSGMEEKESTKLFKDYFSIFPWNKLPKLAKGFDMGCGSGRWAKFVAPKVEHLHCIDPSLAIKVAKKKLKSFKNITYHQKSLDNVDLKLGSQDFGYSLGVLHHVPDTGAAIKSCSKLLKPGAPLLIYIYYNFDNRPLWFKYLWTLSNFLRLIIYRLPKFLKFLICDIIAIFIYFPLAKFALMLEKIGFDFKNFPLYAYRYCSFYVMRTDSRDRFGTPLEKRFTKKEIYKMMKQADLEKIKFSNLIPFWTAVGFKKR